MRRNTLMITALLALPLAAFAGEKKKLTLADLPAKVADPIRAAAGETPVKIKTEKEDGVEAFEAKWDVKGLAHEITVSTEGVVLGLEEVIPVESAPEPVQATIKTLASVGELIGVEKATVKDIVQYEAAFKTAEGKLEVKIDASGKEVSRETKKKKVKKEKEEHEEKDEDGDGD